MKNVIFCMINLVRKKIFGLHTFMRYICHKSWLGGWFLPQKNSYFALQLPKGWWIFGLDQALHEDIDVFQFKFFAELSMNKIGANDSVIIMTHEPNWLLDWYWNNETGKNVPHLIRDYLRGRCKLRMAGDLHHYMRHSVAAPSDKPVAVQHLLVNGCGGAFLHPTHVFRNFNKFYGMPYECKATYPSYDDSTRIALGNILKFRKKNWQFDFIGGFIYFILVFSMFPQCDLDHILRDDSSFGHLKSFLGTTWSAFLYMLQHSYVSLTGTLILVVVSYFFVPSKISRKRHLVIGILHVSAHLTAALILMVLMELGIELCIRHQLIATQGYHTLYQWYRSMESEHFPDPNCILILLVDKVAKEWKLDPNWETEPTHPLQMGHQRQYPSKWRAATSDPSSAARIVDHFTIKRTLQCRSNDRLDNDLPLYFTLVEHPWLLKFLYM